MIRVQNLVPANSVLITKSSAYFDPSFDIDTPFSDYFQLYLPNMPEKQRFERFSLAVFPENSSDITELMTYS